VVILLDGDDWLIPDPNVINYLNDIYCNKEVDMTYGSMWSLADDIPLISQEYPPEVIKSKTYRKHRFNWGIPYTHLRTFRRSVFKGVNPQSLKNEVGWMMAGADNPLFYELIENSNKHYCNKEVICVYNDENPLNDYKINPDEQNRNANYEKYIDSNTNK